MDKGQITTLWGSAECTMKSKKKKGKGKREKRRRETRSRKERKNLGTASTVSNSGRARRREFVGCSNQWGHYQLHIHCQRFGRHPTATSSPEAICTPTLRQGEVHGATSFVQKHVLCYVVLVGAGTSADSLQNRLVGNLREVGTLDVGGNTVQGSSQSVLGGGVHHLGSDWGGVWRPSEEHNLGSLALASTNLVLEVVHGVLTLVLRQLLQEGVVVLAGGGLLDNNLGFLVVQSEDDELEFLAQLQIVEGGQRLIGNSNSAWLVLVECGIARGNFESRVNIP